MANAREILIVDDDTDLRDTLVEQLSLHDEFEASAVDTGAKGASAAKANSPDLVLMDVGLPDTVHDAHLRSTERADFVDDIRRQRAVTAACANRVLVSRVDHDGGVPGKQIADAVEEDTALRRPQVDGLTVAVESGTVLGDSAGQVEG